MKPSPHPDAVVVGAGIVGAACAYELARSGLRVLVLEAGFAGGGTTAAAMGHLVVMDDSEAQLALTAYSRRLWRALAPALPSACEVDPCGTLWVAEDEAEMRVVRRKHTCYTAHGIDAEVLDGEQLAEAEPALRCGLAGALRVPGDAVVYPPAVVRWLVDRACERGAELWEGCSAKAIDDEVVVTDQGTIEAPVVVNAAGAAAARLTPGLEIMPRKGHLVITDRYPGMCRHQLVELGYLKSAHVMTNESVAFNLQPRATGQLLIGSSRELAGWDRSVNRSVLRRMLRRATDFVPRLAALSAIRTWTGFRPATPDKLPVIGRWPTVDGLWLAAGHEGLGITTALGTGRMLAALIADRTPEVDAVPFAPARMLNDATTTA